MALREGVLGDQFVGDSVGLVLALALLVLDHAALFVQLGLVHRAQHVPHAIGFHPQGHVQRRPRHVLEVVGAVFVGRAVEIGRADALHGLEVVVVEVLRTVEHQVLEQVGEASLAGLLVLRSHVVPDVDRDDWRLAVLMNHQRQSVVQNVLRIGDVDFRLERHGQRAGHAGEP